MRAARAARLFFLIRPIKVLICGVVISVAVVDTKKEIPIDATAKLFLNRRFFFFIELSVESERTESKECWISVAGFFEVLYGSL